MDSWKSPSIGFKGDPVLRGENLSYFFSSRFFGCVRSVSTTPKFYHIIPFSPWTIYLNRVEKRPSLQFVWHFSP